MVGPKPLHSKQCIKSKKYHKEILEAIVISPLKSELIVPEVKKEGHTTHFCLPRKRTKPPGFVSIAAIISKVMKLVNLLLPRIDNALDNLRGAEYFSCFDFGFSYFQIEMESGDMHKTIFLTTLGLHEFLRMLPVFKIQHPRFKELWECMLTCL